MSTGALTAWAPTSDQSVLAITAPPGSSRIVVGGKFTVLNATAARGLGALDATTGATLPFPANQVASDYGPNAGIYSLTNDGTNVYATGFNYLVNAPTSGGNFESVLAADVATGNLVWVSGCRGDTYDAAAVAGVVYAVSHAHDCSSVGANPEMPTRSYQYAMAFQTAPAAGRAREQRRVLQRGARPPRSCTGSRPSPPAPTPGRPRRRGPSPATTSTSCSAASSPRSTASPSRASSASR